MLFLLCSSVEGSQVLIAAIAVLVVLNSIVLLTSFVQVQRLLELEKSAKTENIFDTPILAQKHHLVQLQHRLSAM